MTDVEYNFLIKRYKMSGDILVSFDYEVSMYYKDGGKCGCVLFTKTYFINEKVNVQSVEDICSALLRKENVNSLEDSSIFKNTYKELSSNVIECDWSITNVSKES